MELKLTNSIEEFRKKYGIFAPTLEDDFNIFIDTDFESLENEPEIKQRGFIVMHNEELFRKFLDFLNVIGMYNDMFVLICEDRQYYAYPKYAEIGKINILKDLADEAERYKKKAKEIEPQIQKYSYLGDCAEG